MAAGGGAFFGWPVSNTLVVFGLPDLPRKPLPGAVSKAVAAWAATHRGVPKFGPSPRHRYPLLRQVDRASRTGCHAVDVVTSQRMRRPIRGPVDGHDQTGGLQKSTEMRHNYGRSLPI